MMANLLQVNGAPVDRALERFSPSTGLNGFYMLTYKRELV